MGRAAPGANPSPPITGWKVRLAPFAPRSATSARPELCPALSAQLNLDRGLAPGSFLKGLLLSLKFGDVLGPLGFGTPGAGTHNATAITVYRRFPCEECVAV